VPKLGTKHANAEIITFPGFTGGLNLARPPESIAADEMQSAVNFEFSQENGLLRVRGGLRPVFTFPDPLTDLIPLSEEDRYLLARSGDILYKVDVVGGAAAGIGQVSGGKTVSYELWGDGEALMAFGGPLYIYDGMTVSEIDSSNAPANAEVLFVQAGRVMVSETGKDTLRYSGVGDPANWTEDGDADSVSIEVGYKDGCGIKAIAPAAGELIVFKCPDGRPELGRIYRLQGNYPDWNIIPYSRGSSAWNHQSVANVGSDVLFLTREGLGNLATVTEYGDFKLRWAGAKVNPRLSLSLSEKCSLRHIPARSQVWALDGASALAWCYHYEIGGGAWTTFKFPGAVKAVVTVNGKTYLSIGNTLYHMGAENEDDGGSPIQAFLKPGTVMRMNQMLLKSVMARYISSAASEAHLKIGKFVMDMPSVYKGDIAFTDGDIAYFDTDPLVPAPGSVTARKRCNIRQWEITPEVIVRNGAFSLSSIGLEIAEV
jgi:hypothetical protein